jgi:hypothetical protein
MTNVCEQPWLLLIVAGVVLLLVLVYFWLAPQNRKWWHWLPPAIIALSAFGIDFLVQTDAEKVEIVIAKASRAAQNEDVDAIGRLISPDYHDSFNESKEALMRRLEAQLSDPVIEKNVLRILSLTVNPPDANAVFTVRVVFDPKGPISDFQKQMLFKFDAYFIKQADDWFFRRVELLEIDMHPLDWRQIQNSPADFFD